MVEPVIIGDCTMYCEDCLELLPTLGKVDAVVTDPPYGINMAVGFSGSGGFSEPIKRREYEGDWDNAAPQRELLDRLANMGYAIFWGGNYFTHALPQNNFWLVWDKENTMPTFSDCELAWTNIPKNSVKKISYRQNGCMSREKGRYHPTQKPIDVMRWCIEQLPDGCSTILDPFMGSGTTGVACAKMGRKFIGIEREPKYFDIACKRIEDAYKQPDMFIEPIAKPVQDCFLIDKK